MNTTGVGDLAQHLTLRRQNTDLKQQLNVLGDELASGRASDLAAALQGDYSYFADVERSLSINNSYKNSIDEAVLFTSTMQTTLDRIQTVSAGLGSDVLTAAASNSAVSFGAVSLGAQEDLRALVSSLNTSVAGRSLFGGTATDTAPLMLADDMLDELRAAVSGLTDATSIQTVVDDWFNAPGGGFETLGYQGSDTNLSPFQLAQDETVQFDLRADSAEIRDLLQQTAMAALAGDSGLGLAADVQRFLFLDAGTALMGTQAGITETRAGLGFVEERIEESLVRNSATKSSLEIAKSNMVGVDPFETATRLQNVQSQLESLYIVTARLSRLSLADYI